MSERPGDRRPEVRTLSGAARFSASPIDDPLPHTSLGSAGTFARVEAVHHRTGGKGLLRLPIDPQAMARLDWTTIRVFAIDPAGKRFVLLGSSGFDREGQAAWGEITDPGLYGAYGLPADPSMRETLDWLFEVHPMIVREGAFGRNNLLRTICDLILCLNPAVEPPQGACAMCLGLQIPELGLPDFQLIPFRPQFKPLHEKTLPRPCRLVNGPIAYLDVLGNQIIKVSTPTAATQVCVSAINEVVKIPAWSADGKRLAYCVRDGAQSRLETRDANCADVRIVLSGPGDFGWVAWNPAAGASQRELVFTVDTGQGYHLDAINENGTSRRTLVTPSALMIGSQQVRDLLAPAYSPGGQFLAFIADISSNASFVVVTKADGTNPQPISSAAVRAVFAPRWTARGDAVACGVVTMTTQLTEWHFYPIANGVASGPPVIWNNSDIRFLSFSPDGLRVCGARNLPGIPEQLFVGDFDTTTFAVTNIAGVQTRCTSPSWGPVCV